MSKSKKILTKTNTSDPTPLARTVIDNYYANGCNKIVAYCDAKKIEEPTEKKKRMQITSIVSQILLRWPDYKAEHHKKNEKSLKNIKERLTNTLDKVGTAWEQLLDMAQKDELTIEEEIKFDRLRSIISTSDLNKSIDLYSRLTGAFEVEKHEVTHSFKVNFGTETPQVEENNNDVIDVDED